MSKRYFAAIIELDEGLKSKHEETNGMNDMDPGDFLEQEFGWLELSGISLKSWLIMDEDDESQWARYINHIVDWCMNHPEEDFEGTNPPTYEEWLNKEANI